MIILFLLVAQFNSFRRPAIILATILLSMIGGVYLSGGSMWEPMAVTIMFGLLFATALTLGVVPVLLLDLFRGQVPGV